jgi:hypothetical protein
MMRLSNGRPLTASNGKYLLFQRTILLNHQFHFYPRYNSIALRQQLSEDPNFRWCLSVNCDHGQIHPRGGRYQFIAIKNLLINTHCNLDSVPIVQCSQCYKKSCFTHQLPWHEGLTCEEFDFVRPNIAADQEATQRLINSTTQQCPRCKKKVGTRTLSCLFRYCSDVFCFQIERSAGCDHMTCELYFICCPLYMQCFPLHLLIPDMLIF